MKLQLLITFFQVALVESLREVYGYLGDTVTLSSGADPSWRLSKVEWSIFPNNTWIATYQNKKKNTERLHLYTGRLSLNISSGDLMIHNLTTKDAMEYSVDLINDDGQDRVNKIKLIVRQHLSDPVIQTVACTPVKGGWWVVLRCFSTDEGVDFSWQVKPPSVLNINDRNCNSAVYIAFLNTTQNRVEFTCTSSRYMENTSTVIIPACHDDRTQPSPLPLPQSRSRYALGFFLGGILGGSLTIILIYVFGEKIKGAWEYIKGKMFPSKSESQA